MRFVSENYDKISGWGCAITSKAVKVVFNKTVDTTKATFAVTKGSATVQVGTTEWNEAKTEATLKFTSIAAGDYNLSVGGVFETPVAKTFKIEAPVATELTLANTQLPLQNGVKLSFELKDQFGEKIETLGSAYNVSVYDKTQGKSLVAGEITPSGADITLDLDTANNLGAPAKVAKDDELVVTLIHNASAKKVVKTLKVVEATAAGTVTLGTPAFVGGKSYYQVNDLNLELPYEINDQYGQAVTLTASQTDSTPNDIFELNGVRFTSSNPAIVDVDNFTTDANGKLKFKIGATSGTVTLTALAVATGETSTVTLKVEAASRPSSVTLTAPTVGVSESDTDLKLDIVVKDQFDTVLTKDKYSAANFTINSSNSSVIAVDGTSIDPTTGKVDLTVVGKGTATISVTVNATGESATLPITVEEARVPATITLKEAAPTNLVQGSTVALDYVIKDQYGKEWSAANGATAHGDYKVKLSVADVSGDASLLTLTSPSVAANADATEADEVAGDFDPVVNAAAGKTGTGKVTVELIKTVSGQDSTISKVETSFNVVANSSTGLTYSIEDIADLYELGADIDSTDTDVSATDIAAGYVKEIKIKATDAQGNSYVIPASEIVGVTVSDTTNFIVDTDGTKWYVGGKAAQTEAKTATVTVVFNTVEGVKTITKQVKVLPDALTATAMEFKDDVAGTDDAEAVSTLELANHAAYAADIATGNATYLWITDQFGGYSLSEDTNAYTLTFSAANGVTGNADDTIALAGPQDGSVTVTDTDSDTGFTKANASFRVVAYTGNGLSDYIDVKVVDGVLPVATSTVSAQDTIAAGDSITIEFDETNLASTTLTEIEDAIKTQVAAGGAAAADLDFDWDGSVLTVTNNHATDAITWTADASVAAADFKDVAGNEATAAVTIDLKS